MIPDNAELIYKDEYTKAYELRTGDQVRLWFVDASGDIHEADFWNVPRDDILAIFKAGINCGYDQHAEISVYDVRDAIDRLDL